MARIYGISGCTKLLTQEVHKRGLIDINSLKDIAHFRNNFRNILNNVIDTAKKILSNEIDSYKNLINQFIDELKDKIKSQELLLLKEKEEILEQINEQPKKKVPKRFKILEKKFEREVRKPLKKNRKKVKKMTNKCNKIEQNYDKIIKKRTSKKIKQMNKSKQFIEKNLNFVQGAFGEERVIRELIELPDTFIIFNDIKLSLDKSIRWKKYNEYVKSCQIDHVVIGPSGIFLIETKNWNPATLYQTDFLPHRQVDRAGYIFFIKFNKFFRKLKKKVPIRSIVVTLRKLPEINYPHVKQLTPKELISYISWFKRELLDKEVEIAAQWLIRQT